MDKNIKRNQHYWHFITSITFVIILFVMVAILHLLGRIPNSVPLFDFFMLVLAVFRITRLLVHDLVSDYIRDFFEEAEYGIKKSMHDLLDCPWCTGAWVSLGTGFFYFVTPFAWPVLFIFAIAGFGTLLTILASLMMVALEGK